MNVHFAWVAQSVEQRTRNAQVVGSSPTSGSLAAQTGSQLRAIRSPSRGSFPFGPCSSRFAAIFRRYGFSRSPDQPPHDEAARPQPLPPKGQRHVPNAQRLLGDVAHRRELIGEGDDLAQPERVRQPDTLIVERPRDLCSPPLTWSFFATVCSHSSPCYGTSMGQLADSLSNESRGAPPSRVTQCE